MGKEGPIWLPTYWQPACGLVVGRQWKKKATELTTMVSMGTETQQKTVSLLLTIHPSWCRSVGASSMWPSFGAQIAWLSGLQLNTIEGYILIFILCPFSCVVFCNILIIFHFVLGVKEASLSGKQCATSIVNILVFYHSLLRGKDHSVSHKQCFLF